MNGPAFEGWAVLELFGHIKVAGQVTEVEMFGAKCGRIDMPALEPDDGMPAVGAQTQFFGGAAVFRLTPCTEEVARSIARRLRHVAISTFDMYQPRQLDAASDDYGSDTGEEDEDAEDNRASDEALEEQIHTGRAPRPFSEVEAELAKQQRRDKSVLSMDLSPEELAEDHRAALRAAGLVVTEMGLGPEDDLGKTPP